MLCYQLYDYISMSVTVPHIQKTYFCLKTDEVRLDSPETESILCGLNGQWDMSLSHTFTILSYTNTMLQNIYTYFKLNLAVILTEQLVKYIFSLSELHIVIQSFHNAQ